MSRSHIREAWKVDDTLKHDGVQVSEKWICRLQDFKLCNLRCDITTVIILKLYCGLLRRYVKVYEVAKLPVYAKLNFTLHSLPCDLLLFWEAIE